MARESVVVDQAVAPPPRALMSEAQTTLPEASVVSLPPLPEAAQLKAEKRTEEPVTIRPEVVALVAWKFAAKSEVEVAALEVELVAVKFWKVEEPVARMLARVARAFAWKVPVTMEPAVMFPAARLVVDAVVAWR
jgi:hypothetical protein